MLCWGSNAGSLSPRPPHPGPPPPPPPPLPLPPGSACQCVQKLVCGKRMAPACQTRGGQSSAFAGERRSGWGSPPSLPEHWRPPSLQDNRSVIRCWIHLRAIWKALSSSYSTQWKALKCKPSAQNDWNIVIKIICFENTVACIRWTHWYEKWVVSRQLQKLGVYL